MRPRHLAVVVAQASEGLVRRLLQPCVFPAKQLSASMLMAGLVNHDVLAALSKNDGKWVHSRSRCIVSVTCTDLQPVCNACIDSRYKLDAVIEDVDGLVRR
jgi:hypothetical protein